MRTTGIVVAIILIIVGVYFLQRNKKNSTISSSDRLVGYKPDGNPNNPDTNSVDSNPAETIDDTLERKIQGSFSNNNMG